MTVSFIERKKRFFLSLPWSAKKKREENQGSKHYSWVFVTYDEAKTQAFFIYCKNIHSFPSHYWHNLGALSTINPLTTLRNIGNYTPAHRAAIYCILGAVTQFYVIRIPKACAAALGDKWPQSDISESDEVKGTDEISLWSLLLFQLYSSLDV